MKVNIAKIIIAFTIVLSVVLHWRIFPTDISGSHTWRQTQTQWNIINFQKYDANILNTRVAHFNMGDNLYRYEFPLMQWSIAMLHKIFGDDILITRICIFLIGVFSLLAFYRLSLLLFKNEIVAALGVWALNFSPVFYYWTLNPIPDNFALCMGIWHLYYVLKSVQNPTRINIGLGALFLLLATWAKLPFIVFGAAPLVHLLQLLKTDRFRIKKDHVLYALTYVILILPAVAWYWWVIPGWEGNGIVAGVFDNAISTDESLKILEYHLNTMFPKFLTAPLAQILLIPSILLIFVKGAYRKREFYILLGPFLFVLLYFFYELNMIHIYHDYYMMPFMPFLFLGITYTIKQAWGKGLFHQVLTIAILLGVAIQCVNLNSNRWAPEESGANLDLFTHQEALIAAVPEDEKCIILNDVSNFIFAYKIRKRGFVFRENQLQLPWVKDLVENKGIEYMYSDSRVFDEQEAFQAFVEDIILEAGSIKVFKLKPEN